MQIKFDAIDEEIRKRLEESPEERSVFEKLQDEAKKPQETFPDRNSVSKDINYGEISPADKIEAYRQYGKELRYNYGPKVSNVDMSKDANIEPKSVYFFKGTPPKELSDASKKEFAGSNAQTFKRGTHYSSDINYPYMVGVNTADQNTKLLDEAALVRHELAHVNDIEQGTFPKDFGVSSGNVDKRHFGSDTVGRLAPFEMRKALQNMIPPSKENTGEEQNPDEPSKILELLRRKDLE